MNLSDLKNSKFLKKEDVGAGVLVTISHITQENVAKDGADQETKAVMHFHELDKPLVLNSTNGQLIAGITGHDSDIERNWIGARIVLYNDPTIQFGGRIVGGIRVRAPKQGAKLPPPPSTQTPTHSGTQTNDEPPASAYSDDDLPF
jgi:hypothetical protein